MTLRCAHWHVKGMLRLLRGEDSKEGRRGRRGTRCLTSHARGEEAIDCVLSGMDQTSVLVGLLAEMR